MQTKWEAQFNTKPMDLVSKLDAQLLEQRKLNLELLTQRIEATKSLDEMRAVMQEALEAIKNYRRKEAMDILKGFPK